MRIAVVSAHYPPNFTSGGTLVPKRIADGLARRGHDVHVYAGAYETGDSDLWSWTEAAESGATVHWVATTGMLDWGDDQNYDNPRIQAHFTDFLVRVRPQVVHFHSLQGMGGALLTLARAAGCAVVLTMHDMWWWCARQFLADPGLRPCCDVVRCGVCPCQRDNGWLIRRNAGLAAHLDSADLVLAPSVTMVDLLRANGVDPSRLELDENPTVVEPSVGVGSGAPAPDRAGGVRFVYANGPHEVKGSGVMSQAAGLLSGLPGWSLDAYGLPPAAGLPEAVRCLPKYPSSQAVSVLAEYEVLVLPSVMIESYSLLTREALAAGLVVISTENPGPLEVVTHGHNGLVVPRGDAAALADAMRSLVEDSALLNRLRRNASAVTLRPLQDQIEALECRYAALIAAAAGGEDDGLADRPGGSAEPASPPDPRHRPSPIRRVLLLTGINGAPLRYRGRLPQEALADLGVRMDVKVYRDIDALPLARTADAVVLYRCPATAQLLDLIAMVRSRPDPVPVLFDVDDLIFDPDVRSEIADSLEHLSAAEHRLYWHGVRRYRTSLEACDGYIGSTAMLCDEVARLTGKPVHRFANGVGIQLARSSAAALRRPRTPGPPRVGYLSGTDTHNEDWAHVEPAVIEVMRRRPEVHLVLGGLLTTTPELDEMSGRITRLPLLPWYELPRVLRDLDINLAPLVPGRRFNQSKSAIKWLEAALAGTPTVASMTQPFEEAIEPGVTGMLASSVTEFTRAMLALLDDPAAARRMGAAARRRVLLDLSPARQGRRYLQILQQAREEIHRSGHGEPFATGWAPVFDTEPYIPVAPEDYGPVPLAGPSPLAPSDGDHAAASPPRNLHRLVVDYRVSGMRHLRTHGTLATVRKAVQVAATIPARRRSRIR